MPSQSERAGANEHPLDTVYRHEYGAGNYTRWWDPGDGIDPRIYHQRLITQHERDMIN
jgi:hypothetical protein